MWRLFAILLVLTSPALARFHSSIIGTTINIPVSTYSTGAFSANGIGPQFTNPIGNVFTSNFWGATGVKYLASNDPTQFIFTSNQSARDVSVTTWGDDCAFFLRSSGGEAWYFRYNYNTGPGILKIGIVTGLTPGTIDSNGTFYTIYQNANLQGTVSGYDPTNTASSFFTFSVQGFQVCASYNNVTITCFNDYRYTGSGVVQGQCNSGGGIKDTSIKYLPAPSMFSNPSAGILDPRDFGAKAVATTGSISASSNSLAAASSAGFAVGDNIIVATGGEAAGGVPGTIGVGGAVPLRTYANLTAANADLPNQPDGTWMRTLDTEDIYRKFTTWINYQGQIWYQQFANPIALYAQITGISGNTITLNQTAAAATTGTSVYFDNGPAFNFVLNAASVGLAPLTPHNMTFSIPTGNFAFYNPNSPSTQTFAVSVGSDKIGWNVTGQGKTNTKLFTPLGVRSFGATMAANNLTLEDLTIQGTAANVGFVMGYYDTDPSGGGVFEPATIFTGQNQIMQDVACINVFADCMGSSAAFNIQGFRVAASLTDGIQSYTQWQFQLANSTGGGGCTDCSFTSPYLTAGFESFASDGIIYKNFTSVNGVASCNSCTNVTFDSPNITITANSQLSPLSFSANDPVFNMNTNIGGSPVSGGLILNPKVVQQGYIDAGNDSLIFVAVNNQNSGVTVQGTYPSGLTGCFQMPDYAGTNGFLGIGVRNDGANTVISGMRFIGHTDYAASFGNIQSEGGNLTSTNSIMDDSVQGAAPFTETGTQSNATWNAANPGHTGC